MSLHRYRRDILGGLTEYPANLMADLTALTSYSWRKDSSNYATITELTAGSVTYHAVASNSNRWGNVSFSVPLNAGSYTLAWDYEIVSGTIPYPRVAVYTDDLSDPIAGVTNESPLSFEVASDITVRVLLYANSGAVNRTAGYIRYYGLRLVKTS